MHNRAFYRALHSILHPITIGAIVVLLLNDHFLKQHYPSWWTGKLSDFAGLIFAPLIFAAFLAWVIPPRLKNQENWVGIIAFSVTGIIFALTKTIPQANDVTSKFWEFFAGGPVKMWLDPTDLLALPALIIGWLIWNGSSNHAMQVALPALTLIAIGSLAATATSCDYPDEGLQCLQNLDGKIYAFTGTEDGIYVPVFYSSDDGQTWQVNRWTSNTPICSPRPTSWEIYHPQTPDLVYKFESQESIQVSKNGGDSWREAIDLSWYTSEERMRALDRLGPRFLNASCDTTVYPGPKDAIFFEETGQIFVAMGLDGLLVLQPYGQWEWVAVGPYRLEGIETLDIDLFDLWPQMLMGMIVAILIMVIAYPTKNKPWPMKVWLIFCWFIWALCLLQIHLTAYPSEYSHFTIAINEVIKVFLIIALSGSIIPIYSYDRSSAKNLVRKIIEPRLISFYLVTFGLCFAPFLNWLRNTEPDSYKSASYQAILISLGLTVISRILGRRYFGNRIYLDKTNQQLTD